VARASPAESGRYEYDACVIGAGPVGLAIAIELARFELTVLVIDRREEEDVSVRPQLLVARAGDLANLEHLGVPIDDPWTVTMLAQRVERDLASGTVVRGDVVPPDAPAPVQDLRTLASQPPLALVPIGRLQEALLHRAAASRVTTRYGCHVTRLRRHARYVSIACEDGTTMRAAIAIVATGAARPLISTVRGFGDVEQAASARMIAGLFDVDAEHGRWVRVELPVSADAPPARCTLLQTTSAGTALLVDPQLPANAVPEQVHHHYDAAARALGLAGASSLFAPQIFSTALATVKTRFVGLDGRAPILVAGDAAQTGHVFSGQTCFVNLALALRMCDELRHAKRAITERKVNDPTLVRALGRYNAQSQLGAQILARSSARHYAAHGPGAWALAGVARA
jgi:2-polyprenyl-6-methoxyphenol hydroxylase-like FAD-dependent oxidoreductase